MAKEVILKKLDDLHRELLEMKDLDATTVESLQQVAADIRQLLETQDQNDMPQQAARLSIREQIEKLESDHPVATRFLSQFTDFLAMLGI